MGLRLFEIQGDCNVTLTVHICSLPTSGKMVGDPPS